MSIKIMSAVWELQDITASETLLLIALADHANDDGFCWPSVGTIQRRTKLSDRGVQKLLNSLRKKGYVTWTSRNGHSNTYQLPIPLIHTPELRSPLKLYTPPNGVHPPPNPVHPRPPNPVHPESKAVESINESTRARANKSPVVEHGLRALKDVLKNSKPKGKTKAR
jgi:hypothetical protein